MRYNKYNFKTITLIR